jgi:leucyl-tRNA synthetase
MVTHETYRTADGRWLEPGAVERQGDALVERGTGVAVTAGRAEKMSKSKKNTVDPDVILERYGADAVRWFMLSDSPPERDLAWSEAGIDGAARFVQRVWRLVSAGADGATGEDEKLLRLLHRTIAGVTEDIDRLQFNKAVARLYELVNALERAAPSATRAAALPVLVQLVAPMCPHLAEEGWAALGRQGFVHEAAWPVADPALLVDDQVTIAVQVNGKLKDSFETEKSRDRAALEADVLAREKVVRALEGRVPKKVIVVPDRLVNLVV